MRNFIINAYHKKSVIAPEIYGHFIEHLGRCIYDGLFVGTDSSIAHINGFRVDVIDALKKLHIPVLRWPGGCFADTYHWKDGVGPQQNRKRVINIHWGGQIEDNSFGTHEFLTLCEMLGCKAYLVGNVGTGTPQELSDWIDYVNGDAHSNSEMVALRKSHGREKPWNVTYWGIGNENWGCGGAMTPEQYSDVFRIFSSYAGKSAQQQIYRIACGPNDDHVAWTEIVSSRSAGFAEGMGFHKYAVVRRDPTIVGHRGHMSATGFSLSEYEQLLCETIRIEQLIAQHSALLAIKSPRKTIDLVIDEWGNWHRNEEGTNHKHLFQQNSLLDALCAATTLHIFNNHSDTISMANLAQMVNVLQSLLLTKGNQMLCTPTYHVFNLLQGHMGSTVVDSFIEQEVIGSTGFRFPDCNQSVSVAPDKRMTITITNLNPHKPLSISTKILGFTFHHIHAKILTHAKIDGHNTFEAPNSVEPEDFTSFICKDSLDFVLPAKSVCSFTLE